VGGAAITGFAFRLAVPAGTGTGSRLPYVTVAVGAGDPVAFAPSPDGGYAVAFERPVELPAAALPVSVSFDLRPGYTPADLRTAGGDRLDPAAVLDVELALFLSGTA
jgi:hypothetical protein